MVKIPKAILDAERARETAKKIAKMKRELRFGGAALRQLRKERGVGRPPKKLENLENE